MNARRRATGMLVVIALVAVVLGAVGARTAHGRDRGPDAADKVRKTLRDPSTKTGFSADFEISIGGAVIGTAALKAEPGTYEGEKAWHITETFHWPVDPVLWSDGPQGAEADEQEAEGRRSLSIRREAWLAKDLSLLYGRWEEKGTAGERTRTFTWKTDQVHVENEADEADFWWMGPEYGEPVSCRRPPLATRSGLLLFLRALPRKEAHYELPWFRERRPEGEGFLDGDWSIDSRERFAEEDLYVAGTQPLPRAVPRREGWCVLWRLDPVGLRHGRVSRREGDPMTWDLEREAEFHLDPKTRDLLLLHHPKTGLVVARPGLVPPPPTLTADAPPQAADEAALRFLVGLGQRDRALVESALHAPTMRWVRPPDSWRGKTPIRAETAPPEATLEALLEAELDPYRQPRWLYGMATLPRAVATGIAVEALATAKGPREESRVRLELGLPLEGVSLTLKRFDATWQVVEAIVPKGAGEGEPKPERTDPPGD